MKKRSTKILSLILALVMVFSLFPMSAFAAGNGANGLGLGGRTIDPRPMDQYPAQTLTSDEVDGLTVTVDAPKGALPLDVEMNVTKVEDLSAVQAAVDALDDVNGTALVAADITFVSNGKEIQPKKEVTVTMASDALPADSSLTVVHLDAGVGELDDADVTAEPVAATVDAEANAVSFDADKFSVYAVIGDGQTGDEARVTVNFYNGSTKVATVYVKNSDVLLGTGERQNGVQYIEDIVYDPGIGGQLPSGKLFRGWSPDVTGLTNKPAGTYVGNAYHNDTTPLTIEDVQSLLDSFVITEGDVLNVYAMVFNVFNVTYEDAKGVTLASEDVLCSINDTSAPYTVSQNYTAVDDTHNFEGWNVKEGAGYISNAKFAGAAVAAPYKQETTMDISGNVIFSVVISEGHWLVFDENGKGATYNAPVFVHSGEKASAVRPDRSLPDNMERTGYTFVGWYTGAPASQYGDPTGSEFNFDQELTDKVTIYAKWRVADSANYTVVVWLQKVTGGTSATDYDYLESKTLTGTPNTTVNTLSQTGATVTDADGSYKNVVVNGWKELTGEKYLGFHADRYDTNVTIKPNGSTVVNVYYNRNMVELNFFLFNATGGYTRDTAAYEAGVEYYGRFTNDTRPTPSNNGTNYLRIYNYQGTWWYPASYYDPFFGSSYYYYDANGNYSPSYSGYRYVKNGSWQKQTNMTMRGLYGSTLAENNKTWNTTYDWHANGHRGGGVSGIRTTFLDAFIPASTSMVVNYYGATPAGAHTIHFLKQNASGTGYTEANTVKAGNENGINFNLSDKYTGFKCVSWSTDNSNYNNVGEQMEVNGDLYYDAHPETSGYQYIETEGDLWIRFDRLSYKIKYSDGAYRDYKDEKFLEDEEPVAQGFGESADITYGASIADYGDPTKSVYNKPEQEGYYFAGWYADSTCQIPYTFTTMPLGGVTVYAKWVQVGYRVFLHPDAGTDPSLDWGSTTQAMNFSVGYGGTISVPTGRRTGYEFLNWFTADDSGYNPDTRLNDTTVPASPAYDKTKDWTDDMDKWGNITNPSNSDVNRPWITRKLDLYAKWSQTVIGSLGIGVIYDDGEGEGAPTDTRLYKDNVDAVAQAASTAPTPTEEHPEEQQFLHWVVQKWTGSAWEDTDVVVYPGETFTIHMADAKIVDNNTGNVVSIDDLVDSGSYTYTIQVRAEYGIKDAPTPTHITWYSNVYDSTGTELSDVQNKMKYSDALVAAYGEPQFEDGKGWYVTSDDVQVNAPIAIPAFDSYTYDGCVFLGWGRVDNPIESGRGPSYITDPADLDESDLFLKWVPGEGGEAGHYEAEFPSESKAGETEWKEVSAVAADEFNPYQDLYAIWVGSFSVYHSATGKVERVMLTGDALDTQTGKAKTFNLTALVDTQNYLYGGYYKDYAGKSANFSIDSLLWAPAESSAYAAGSQMSTYAGSGLVATATDNGATLYNTAANINAVDWVHDDAYTAAGNAITPKAGDVYYIKEVPASLYLRPALKYTYKHGTGEIGTMWVVSDVDEEENYTSIGFKIGGTNYADPDVKVTDTLTIIATTTGVTQNFTVSMFKAQKGSMSYMCVFNKDEFEYDGTTYAAVTPNKLENEVFVAQYWVTPDGATVTSGFTRTYRNLETTQIAIGTKTENASTIEFLGANG